MYEDYVLKELVCLSIFIILSFILAIAMLVAGFVCQYNHNNSIKNSTYECGIKPDKDARINFDIKFFNYAVLFLIFDIETIFLYPFAVFVNALGLFAIVETFVFIGILLFGLIIAINKKMIRWI